MTANDIRLIAVICPTYGREHRLAEMVKSFKETQVGWSSLYIVPRWDGKLITDAVPEEPIMAVTHLPYHDWTMTKAFSNYAMVFSKAAAMVALGANDLIYVTPGWDRIILKEQEKLGPGVYYCRDELRNESLCNHPFITSSLLEQVGFGALPGTHHLYLDNTWFEIGKAIGKLYYLPHVTIKHMHPTRYPELDDDHYRRVNSPALYQSDGELFRRWKEKDLPDLAKRLICSL